MVSSARLRMLFTALTQASWSRAFSSSVTPVSYTHLGELPVLWMLRNVVFVTEKRSHTSKLQNTLGSVHDGDLILRHQFFATMSSDEFKKDKKITPLRKREGLS